MLLLDTKLADINFLKKTVDIKMNLNLLKVGDLN